MLLAKRGASLRKKKKLWGGTDDDKLLWITSLLCIWDKLCIFQLFNRFHTFSNNQSLLIQFPLKFIFVLKFSFNLIIYHFRYILTQRVKVKSKKQELYKPPIDWTSSKTNETNSTERLSKACSKSICPSFLPKTLSFKLTVV